jgi:O-methyltransferase involved in polyketide biosynthesis
MIPLWARGVETGKRRPIVRDLRAAALLRDLDYDFGKFKHAYGSQLTCVLRGLVYDAWTRQLAVRGGVRTVVELGAGLGTRCDRLADLDVHWLDVDHPAAIDLRRRVFDVGERGRQTFLASSIVDADLCDRIAALSPAPHCFVAEGVLMYLAERDVRRLFERLASAFPGAYIAFDSISPVVVGNERLHDSMRFMPAAPFQWGISDVRAMEGWIPGLEVVDVVTVPEIPARFPAHVGLRLRVLAKAVHVALAPLVRTYRIALARLPGASHSPS